MADKSSTHAQVLSMGKAGLVSRALAVLVPIALVRLLDMEEFGQYRLLWLVGGTALLVASLGIPKSLLYFLPRSDEGEKHHYVFQTILILAATSLLSALFVGPWNPWLPDNVRQLSENVYTVPAFVFLWVLTSIIEVLPNADQRIAWQVRAIIAGSIFRTVALIGVAALTEDLESVYLAMIGFGLFQLGLLALYTLRYHGGDFCGFSAGRLRKQVGYAIPTGVAGSMFQLRRLGEQWVVALLFTPAVFAVFAVAATVLPLVQLVRRPVQAVILPKMNRAQGEQDIERLAHLNRQGNVAVSLVLLPTIGLLMVLAEPLMSVLFGQEYSGAGVIFQVYLVGLIPSAIEVGTILFAYAQTRFVMNVSLVLTAIGLVVSVVGALSIGPAGAALGSVFSGYAGMGIRFRRAIRITNIPLSKLQNWSSLGLIALVALLATAAAIMTLSILSRYESGLLELLVGAAIFSLVYFSLLKAFGQWWMVKALLGRGRWGKPE